MSRQRATIRFGQTLTLLAILGAAACSSNGSGGFSTGSSGGGASRDVASGDTGSGAGGTGDAGSGTGGSGTGGGGGLAAGGGGGGANGGGAPVASASSGTVSRLLDQTAGVAGGALVTVGNVALTTGPAGGLGDRVSGVGEALQTGGVSGVPVAGGTVSALAGRADALLNPLAAATVNDRTLIGSGAPGAQQAIGVSVLSPNQTPGTQATIGVLAAGQPVTANLGGASLFGGGTGGGLLGGSSPGTGALAGATGALTGDAAGNLLGVDAANATVLGGGAQPVIGASLLSSQGASGGAVTANVLSGAGTSVSVGGLTLGR